MEKSFNPETQLLEFLPEYLVEYPNPIHVVKGYMDGVQVHEIQTDCDQAQMQFYYNNLELKHIFNIIDKPV